MVMFIMCLIIAVIDATFAVAKRRQEKIFFNVQFTSFSGIVQPRCVYNFNPFAPGDFADKRVLKLVEWFSGHCHAIKS